jgi:hypothetical protein
MNSPLPSLWILPILQLDEALIILTQFLIVGAASDFSFNRYPHQYHVASSVKIMKYIAFPYISKPSTSVRVLPPPARSTKILNAGLVTQFAGSKDM